MNNKAAWNEFGPRKLLIAQLQEPLSQLGQNTVATFLIGTLHGLIGRAMIKRVDARYLADPVVPMRYYEAESKVRQPGSVMQKRGGDERMISYFKMANGGIHIGPPLREFRRVLIGVPILEEDEDNLSEGNNT